MMHSGNVYCGLMGLTDCEKKASGSLGQRSKDLPGLLPEKSSNARVCHGVGGY